MVLYLFRAGKYEGWANIEIDPSFIMGFKQLREKYIKKKMRGQRIDKCALFLAFVLFCDIKKKTR